MAFLVKALFSWNKCSKNTDIILSNFFTKFFKFFLNIEEFWQILSKRQVSNQLDDPNRNYRGGGGAEGGGEN